MSLFVVLNLCFAYCMDLWVSKTNKQQQGELMSSTKQEQLHPLFFKKTKQNDLSVAYI